MEKLAGFKYKINKQDSVTLERPKKKGPRVQDKGKRGNVWEDYGTSY